MVAGHQGHRPGGSYLSLPVGPGIVYLWRLILRYRLQKKAMEYQYLLTLAERHGVIVIDPKAHPELAAEPERRKDLPDAATLCLTSPISPHDPDAQ
jgi:hypothetical protein